METVKIIKKNESLLQIEGSETVHLNIYNYFKFRKEGYQFMPSFRQGRWDGYISLYNKNTGILPQGLLNILVAYLQSIKYDIKIDPKLKVKHEVIKYEDIESFLTPLCRLTPYDYQIAAIASSLSSQKNVIISPTASGKSLIIFGIISWLLEKTEEKIIIIVPTTTLVMQLKQDFLDYCSHYPDYQQYLTEQMATIFFDGDEKSTLVEKRVIISTWQSLQSKNIGKYNKYMKDFGALIIDECHGTKGEQLTKLNNKCINAKYKIGLTGTVANNDVDELHVISLFGKMIKTIDTSTMIKANLAADLVIKNIILEYEDKPEYFKMDYKELTDVIKEDQGRIKVIDKLLSKMSGNTLIIFKDIKNGYGKQMYRLAKKYSDNCYYIDGNTKTHERDRVRKLVDTNNEKKFIIASLNTFGTGINMKSINNLVFVENTKSKIKVLQAIGRGLRVKKDGSSLTVYDIIDSFPNSKTKNYLYIHFLERLKIYKKSNFKYGSKVIKN